MKISSVLSLHHNSRTGEEDVAPVVVELQN